MLSTERLEQRRAGIGGSDMAAVLGESPYKTPLDVYYEKLGMVDPDDLSDNRAVEWGNRLEDAVADKFADDTGLKVRRNNQLLQHKEHPFLLANIDRAIVKRPFGVKCGLECKTAGVFAAKPHLWGEGATFGRDTSGEPVIVKKDDQVPSWYLLQCAHYMAVTDSDMWLLSVLIGGQEFKTYTIERDMELEEMLIERAGEFWHGHVEARVPPPPTNLADIETMYPRSTDKQVQASPEIIELLTDIKLVKGEMSEREAVLKGRRAGNSREGGLETDLKAFFGDADTIVDPGGSVLATWRSSRPSRRFDTKAFQSAHPDLYESFCNEVPGSRRLLIK